METLIILQDMPLSIWAKIQKGQASLIGLGTGNRIRLRPRGRIVDSRLLKDCEFTQTQPASQSKRPDPFDVFNGRGRRSLLTQNERHVFEGDRINERPNAKL